MITSKDIEDELQKIEEVAPKYAKAKADSYQAMEWKKIQKSLLFAKAFGRTVADKENWVAIQPEHIVAAEGVSEAIEEEEKLRWDLKQSELKIEIWRTEQATLRAERMM
jgi:hypothetical protein|tara:strand:+ start:84 stop:410 length:327 start_codon:yes stop_codon:yes gene_type:complete